MVEKGSGDACVPTHNVLDGGVALFLALADHGPIVFDPKYKVNICINLVEFTFKCEFKKNIYVYFRLTIWCGFFAAQMCQIENARVILSPLGHSNYILYRHRKVAPPNDSGCRRGANRTHLRRMSESIVSHKHANTNTLAPYSEVFGQLHVAISTFSN